MYQNFFLKQKKKKRKKEKEKKITELPPLLSSPLPFSLFHSFILKRRNNEEHRKRKWTTYAQLRA
jgi:hypothetical protein